MIFEIFEKNKIECVRRYLLFQYRTFKIISDKKKSLTFVPFQCTVPYSRLNVLDTFALILLYEVV